MRTIIILVFFVHAIDAYSSDDTNTIPTLTLQGRTYTNVSISRLNPVDAIVVFDGGGMRVHWTDLPEPLQKRFGYDPVKAKEYLAAKGEKKSVPPPPGTTQSLAIPAPALTNPPATTQAPVVSAPMAESHRMRVINIVATNIYARCLVSVDGSECEVLLDRLPPPVKQSFEGVYSLETMLVDFAKKVDVDKAKADSENAAASPTGVLDGAHLQKRIDERRQAELDLFNVQREEKDLAQMKSYLKSVRDENQKMANILAIPTGKIFAGAQIWKCVGQSP